MRTLQLTRGKEALLDDEDYERVKGDRWHVTAHIPARSASGYAQGRPEDGKHGRVLLHRYLLGITDRKVFIDHKNGNGLDCRRDNLRIATKSQNAANSVKRRNALTSIYKGVYQLPGGRFCARIARKHIGVFDTQEEAGLAYNAAALEKWGEYAKPN